MVLLILAFTVFFSSFSSALLSPDGQALLEIKHGFNDTKNVLKSWKKADQNPCSWSGIICHFPDLRVRSINLPYLQLGGIISPGIGKLHRLQRLALHQNSLHGSIPPQIRNCSELKALYLRDNYLEGSIPSELGELTHLTILDLSSNLLRGTIPPSIGKLTHLRFLNLSTNFFSGEIPNVGVISSFRSTSFVGNLELCGHPVKKLCRDFLGFPAILPHPHSITTPYEPSDIQPVTSGKTSHFFNGVLIGSMSTLGAALLVMLGVLWIVFLSRKWRVGENYVKVDNQLLCDTGAKLITFRSDLPYSSEEIIKKLDLLDEEDILGSGGFGTVYKMVMDDSNAFAVKRIIYNRANQDQDLEKELEALGSIKHINLVNLRGYCRLPTAKLLIYDYLDLGSLDSYLHESDEGEQPLNWNARMKIALGSARGLAYLHHDCSPSIVHRDIKSSNILLDRSLEPHVSDFGLAKLLVDDDAHVTTVVAGSFGYLAPEYLQSGNATEKCDVYSFGVLLLELVSGRRPMDACFLKKGLNIVGWMNTMSGKYKLEEIVDDKCGNVDVEAVEAILDIAAMCTDAEPSDRPSMSRVLQMLEEEVMSPCSSHFYESHFDI